VYITEVDYGDDDHIAPAKTPNWNSQLDNAQRTGYHDFVKAAVSGGADWICMWGVADNTNQYWRMGQNALLFNEQYQPKSAYEGFKQGILDGKAAVKIARHALKSDNHKIAVNLTDNNIYLNIPTSIGMINIYNISGKCIISSSVKNNKVNIKNLSHGVYFIKVISQNQNYFIYKFRK
jgi:hypothetical protein